MTNMLNDPASAALARANECAAAADAWVKKGVADAESAERCANLLRVIIAAEKSNATTLDAELEPHKAEQKRINSRWTPVKDTLSAAKTVVKCVLKAFADAEESKRISAAATAAAAAAEAKRKAEEAERIAEQDKSATATIAAMVATAQAAAAVAVAESVPDRVRIGGYGKQMSVRSSPRKARLVDDNPDTVRDAVLWMLDTHRDKTLELLITVASADARAKRTLPKCFEIYTTESLV